MDWITLHIPNQWIETEDGHVLSLLPPASSRRTRSPLENRWFDGQRVVALMAEGRSLEGCAALLGVHPDSLYEWQKVHPEFSEAVRSGRAAATTYWENRLLAVANGEPVNAQAIQLA
jgi:hypothetical protein